MVAAVRVAAGAADLAAVVAGVAVVVVLAADSAAAAVAAEVSAAAAQVVVGSVFALVSGAHVNCHGEDGSAASSKRTR